MSKNVASTAAAVTRYGLTAAACAYLAVYLVVAAVRLLHPFELEWMEGAMVDHVRRIVQGVPIYVAPSLDFVPFIYPPAFYYVSAGVAQVTGSGFMALRIVSLLSSLVTFALIYLFVMRETRDRLAAFAAVGLFAATYRIGGSFFDVGRVDSLFLALLAGALYVLRFGSTFRAHIIGGSLIGLAFLTKQSAIVMAAPAVLYVMYRHPRHGSATAAAAVAVGVGATLLLDLAHSGWYRFYAFELPSGYPMLASRLVDFWRVDLVPPLAIAWVLGMLYFVAAPTGSPRLFYVAIGVGTIAGSWLSRGNPGGYFNVLIPAYFTACVLFGLGLHAGRDMLAASPEPRRGEAWLGAAALLQFAMLAYNPAHELPSAADREAGDAFVRRIAAVDGDVWIPYHGHLATAAGKPSFAHWMAVSDILNSARDSVSREMRRQVDEALRVQRFGLIVQSSKPFLDAPDFEQFYVSAGAALPRKGVLTPVTGSPRRMELLYLPRKTAAVRSVARDGVAGPTP